MYFVFLSNVWFNVIEVGINFAEKGGCIAFAEYETLSGKTTLGFSVLLFSDESLTCTSSEHLL